MAKASTTEQNTYLRHIKEYLKAAPNAQQLFRRIVNAPFQDKVTATMMDLGIVVFLLVNKKTKTIDRVALSNTEPAKGAVRMSEKPFKEIKIPINYIDNIIAKAIKTGKPQQVTDWQYLFIPALTPEAARFNQAGAAIECSYVYPLAARNGGALIFSYFQLPNKIGSLQRNFMQSYSKLVTERLNNGS